MKVWLSPALFLAAFVGFLMALLTGTKLGPERMVPPTKRQFWTAWIPGEFTARGQRLRRRITLLGLAGAILLGSALVV
jgi:hypothetical protein